MEGGVGLGRQSGKEGDRAIDRWAPRISGNISPMDRGLLGASSSSASSLQSRCHGSYLRSSTTFSFTLKL